MFADCLPFLTIISQVESICLLQVSKHIESTRKEFTRTRFNQFSGTYKPQVKVFELAQLSMKFERHIGAEVVQFEVRKHCQDSIDHACFKIGPFRRFFKVCPPSS
jgi:hypothetical protein